MKKHLVWSVYVRIFHWSLAVCFLMPYFFKPYHKEFGTAFLVLAISRIIWGFGSVRYTKFKDFTFSELFDYLKNALKSLKTKAKFDEKTKIYGGHNVASSYAILVMLIGGVFTSSFGLMIYFIKKGFIEVEDKKIVTNFLGDIHGVFAIFVFMVVIAHVLGVLIEKYRGGDSLNSMLIDGKKVNAKFDAKVSNFWKIFAVISYAVAIYTFIIML